MGLEIHTNVWLLGRRAPWFPHFHSCSESTISTQEHPTHSQPKMDFARSNPTDSGEDGERESAHIILTLRPCFAFSRHAPPREEPNLNFSFENQWVSNCVSGVFSWFVCVPRIANKAFHLIYSFVNIFTGERWEEEYLAWARKRTSLKKVSVLRSLAEYKLKQLRKYCIVRRFERCKIQKIPGTAVTGVI